MRPRALVLALLGGLPWVLPPARGGDEPTPPAAPALVTLSELRADPSAHLGEEVICVLQLGEAVPVFNPYLTRFGPGAFLRFAAWGDERFLWERAAFDDPAPYVFARRGTPAADALAAGRVYDRFEVRAVEREVFLGEPWIEVLAAQRLTEQVSEGALLHAVRGLDLLREGNAELARGQLERAQAGFLPEHARAELDRLIATCSADR
jgi:hypothetical protein